jgi:hypothetical protein
MATAYANPIPAPEFMEADGRYDHAAYEARCKAYRAETERYIRAVLGGRHKVTGKILRFPVADGYAQYMIWTPTKWIHLDEVDGYHADAATVRGMRAQDVLDRVESAARLHAMFGARS